MKAIQTVNYSTPGYISSIEGVFYTKISEHDCHHVYTWKKGIEDESNISSEFLQTKYNLKIIASTKEDVNDSRLLGNDKSNIFICNSYNNDKLFSSHIACTDKKYLNEIVEDFQRSIQQTILNGDFIKVTCWYKTTYGSTYILKKIECPPPDNTIYENYPSTTRKQLQKLTTSQLPSGGQMIIFHGPPGGGKTWFIRYLANRWKEKCRYHYITDPENFFTDAAYLFNVINYDTSDDVHKDVSKRKWNVLILEDAGSFIELDENKGYVNVSLNKLLNITDGILGQGLKLLLIITTNKEDHKLNPAIYRSGRCHANITFESFDTWEADKWYKKHNRLDIKATKPQILADMYTNLDNNKLISNSIDNTSTIGFNKNKV